MTLDDLKKFADSNNLPAITSHLNSHPDPLLAATWYLELLLHAYWQQKNIPAVISLAHAATTYTLKQAAQLQSSNPDTALKLKNTTKAITYNLASFLWPGWNEPGIALTPEQKSLGQKAAQQHSEICQALNLTPIQKSRAAWILAAHHLTNKRYNQALTYFAHAAQLANESNKPTDHLLNIGYALLAQLKSQLLPLEHGPDFVQQLETAEAVCKAEPVA